MTSFQPFLHKHKLDDDVLAADFGNGPIDANQSYHLGERAPYRKLVMHLPLWRYVPYEAVVCAQAIHREFRVGG